MHPKIFCLRWPKDKKTKISFSFTQKTKTPSSDAVINILQVTLSGLLNFVDGLWSGCGDERIIIFTTHHKDWLDPALLRPGGLNMHIHMSYLKSDAFNVLASSHRTILALMIISCWKRSGDC